MHMERGEGQQYRETDEALAARERAQHMATWLQAHRERYEDIVAAAGLNGDEQELITMVMDANATDAFVTASPEKKQQIEGVFERLQAAAQ